MRISFARSRYLFFEENTQYDWYSRQEYHRVNNLKHVAKRGGPLRVQAGRQFADHSGGRYHRRHYSRTRQHRYVSCLHVCNFTDMNC